MIHRAVFGSIERFMGLLIEHYAGDFPLWLAPEQARILPITAAQNESAQTLLAHLRTLGLRSTIDQHGDTIGSKIRRAEMDKIPLALIVGKREAAASTVSLRSRAKGDKGTFTTSELLARITPELAPAAQASA